eukprot:s1611_g16.t2
MRCRKSSSRSWQQQHAASPEMSTSSHIHGGPMASPPQELPAMGYHATPGPCRGTSERPRLVEQALRAEWLLTACRPEPALLAIGSNR